MRATERAIGRIESGTSQANPTGTPKVEPLPPLHQGWFSHSKATGPCELTLEKFEELKKFYKNLSNEDKELFNGRPVPPFKGQKRQNKHFRRKKS